MKANELRIGNLVYNPTLKEVRTIDCLDIRDLFEGRLWHPFEPIELNHSWLETLGFKCTVDQFRYETDKYLIEQWVSWGEYFFHVKIGKGESIFITKLDNVHELQNLYFALTGEELQLTTSQKSQNSPNNR